MRLAKARHQPHEVAHIFPGATQSYSLFWEKYGVIVSLLFSWLVSQPSSGLF